MLVRSFYNEKKKEKRSARDVRDKAAIHARRIQDVTDFVIMAALTAVFLRLSNVDIEKEGKKDQKSTKKTAVSVFSMPFSRWGWGVTPFADGLVGKKKIA